MDKLRERVKQILRTQMGITHPDGVQEGQEISVDLVMITDAITAFINEEYVSKEEYSIIPTEFCCPSCLAELKTDKYGVHVIKPTDYISRAECEKRLQDFRKEVVGMLKKFKDNEEARLFRCYLPNR